MLIIPAIDIKNGKCVRLIQGDFSKEKIYADDPVVIAQKWEAQGAKILHLVDLDGAKDGKSSNFNVIKEIVNSVEIPVQLGGGIRTLADAKRLFSVGVSRIILGTVALDDKKELLKILKQYKTKIVVGLDAKKGNLMIKGWLKKSDKDAVKTAIELEQMGVQRFIYTDITKDGMLTEPNYKEIARLRKTISKPVIASGGISTLVNIKKLKKLGVEGAIIGKALYEGKIDLQEAIHVS